MHSLITTMSGRKKFVIVERPNRLKYIDLFCGIGGFHQHCVRWVLNTFWHVIRIILQQVYEMNYDIVEDVKVETEEMPILISFVPLPGSKRIFDDERGSFR